MFNPQMMSQLQNQQFNSQQLALLNQMNQLNPLLVQSQLAANINHAGKASHGNGGGNSPGTTSATGLSSMSPMSMMIPGAGQYLLIPQSLIQCQGQLGQSQLGQGQFQQSPSQLHHQFNQQLLENRNQHLLDVELFNQQQVASNMAHQQHKQQQQKRQNDFMKSSEMMNNIARPTKDLQKMGKIHQLGTNGPSTPTADIVNTKNTNQLNAARPLPKRVLVTRLPPNIKTVEGLADVFYPYGIISEIQIFKEKSQVPENLLDIVAKVDPRQNPMPAATVEFETSQAAKFAVSIMRKREKQLQFRVALLKGDTVHEKHCHNYQTQNKKGPNAVTGGQKSGPEDNSSGYESSSSKSSSPKPTSSADGSEYTYNPNNVFENFEDLSLSSTEALADSVVDNRNFKKNLGPIGPPHKKHQTSQQKFHNQQTHHQTHHQNHYQHQQKSPKNNMYSNSQSRKMQNMGPLPRYRSSCKIVQ